MGNIISSAAGCGLGLPLPRADITAVCPVATSFGMNDLSGLVASCNFD